MKQSHNKYVMGVRIDCLDIGEVVQEVIKLSKTSSYGYVCAANVHMLMEAHDSKGFKDIINNAAIICPDGMPIVWLLRRLGIQRQQRITGYDIMNNLIMQAEKSEIPIGVLGGEESVLIRAVENLETRNRNLKIHYKNSPPYRELTLQENESLLKDINESGVELLFVALGCPKQEKWMHDNASEICAVMIGVGAVIEFLAGTKKRAPILMQDLGLEWLYRFFLEPRRLFKRYIVLNSRFIVMVMRQVISGKL